MGTVVSRWGEHGNRPEPLAANAELFDRMVIRVMVDVACTPTQAWSLVADVTRIGEFSPECIGASWVGADPRPRVGGRFDGTNRIVTGSDELIWVRPCTILVAEPGRRFGYVVGDRFDGSPASRWVYDFYPARPSRCRIQLTFEHARNGLSGLRLIADADPTNAPRFVAAREAELAAGMQTTLHNMKRALEVDRLSSDRMAIHQGLISDPASI